MEELKKPYFSWIKEINQAYPEAEVFLVGGAVRDNLIKKETKDYDFVIRGIQARHLRDFLGKVGIVNLVGKTFGVYKFVPEIGYQEFKNDNFEAFDIALPRTEHAWGTGGYRDVEVQSDHELSIEKDLGRRDYTINAIALNVKNNKIEDPYQGIKDIENKIIRAVGNPIERFHEDYTRMLRGLRFACQLNFNIEENTMKGIQETIKSINDVREKNEFVSPREVIAQEFIKAFYANPVKAFDLYDQSGAFEQLIPKLLKMKNCPQPAEFHAEGDVWTHTRLALQQINSPEFKKTFPDIKVSALLAMAVLFHDIGKPPMIKTPEDDGVDRIRFNEHDAVGAQMAREIANRLKLSVLPEKSLLHVDGDALHWLIENHLLLLNTKAEDLKASTVEKYFFNERVPGETLLQLMYCDGMASLPKDTDPDLQNLFDMQTRIKRMATMVRGRKGLPKPLLNGDEIMEILNLPPGPGIGEVIRELREEQLSARATSKQEAIDFIKGRFA